MEQKKDFWKVLDSETLFSFGYFTVKKDKCELPDGRIMPAYLTMEFGAWVHMVAVTPSGDMILVEQYRHAAKDSFLELPGGAADPEELDSPEKAAKRELLEETGYQSQKVKLLGSHYPNPALQSNLLFSYLALNCEKVSSPQLDPYEDLTVLTLPVKEVYARLDEGQIRHSLMFPSLVLARPYLKQYLSD